MGVMDTFDISLRTEWYLRGPGVWVTSLASILINLLLLLLHLRNPKRICTKASIYTIFIALSGIALVVIFQENYIKETVNSYDHSSLVNFSLSKTCAFLREFLPYFLDLLVLSDCANRYILICSPQHKAKLLGWKFMTIYIGCILGVSSMIAALEVRYKYDLESFNKNFFILYFSKDYKLFKRAWIYQVALKATISVMMGIFQAVITTRICRELGKSVRFLIDSNANSKGIVRYTKIMNFSIAVCIIVLIYNLVLDNINLGLWVKEQLFIFKPTLSLMKSKTYDTISKIVIRVLDILFCFKPSVYGFAYIWVKVF